MQREELDMTGAMPSVPCWRTSTTASRWSGCVRPVGHLPPLLARTVAVDDLVAQWHELRAAAGSAAGPVPPEPHPGAEA